MRRPPRRELAISPHARITVAAAGVNTKRSGSPNAGRDADADGRAGRDPDPVDVDRVLVAVERPLRPTGRRRDTVRARRPSTEPLTNSMSSLGSSGSGAGALARQRARQVEHAEPRRGVPAGLAHVARAEAHDLGGLVGRQLRPGGADPGHGGRHHRRGEGGARQSANPSGLPSGSNVAGTPASTLSPGALRSTSPRSGWRRTRRVVGADRGDGQHVRQAGRELGRVALAELVAGRGHRHDPARRWPAGCLVLRAAAALEP